MSERRRPGQDPLPWPAALMPEPARALWREHLRNARWRVRDERMPHNRIKRIHFSPAGNDQIICGANKAATRGLRFTKVKLDVTCTRCRNALASLDDETGFDPKVIDTLLDAEDIDREKVKAWVKGLWPQAKKLAALFYRSRIEELMRNLGFDKARCRSCGRTIYWVVHKNGKKVPYTIDGQNHFANCPQADAFRRKKR